MEKIKKALELARESNTIGKAQDDQHTLPKSGSSHSDHKISYTQTKTINVPADFLREKRIILGDVHDPVADAYKVLRTYVLQNLKANQWNSLAITSPMKNNGKTLTAINLAVSLAREVNHTVLLVDMDLRSPSIHRYFYEDDKPGICEYLNNTIGLSDILFNPGIERLVVLPGNVPLLNSSEMLSSPKMVQLVEELKCRYPSRIIIFDMPPLLSSDDMIAFSPYIDGIMLVVEEGKTRKDELKRAYELIQDKNIIGTVLNKSEDQGSAYGYF